jgi:2-polyprenyl-6-hydroxyphenyl methylase/3-demethylubiquinone-9 3-methyltransferase
MIRPRVRRQDESRIDNAYYDTLGAEWWDAKGRAGGLHAMNPARVAYFAGAIDRAGIALSGARILDVGCGGGILSEALAASGAIVTGIDRSGSSVSTARAHAQGLANAPRYARADALRLPFADASFDAVVSSDFLEHVADLAGIAREMARVVRPGGAICFDTINRTILSRVVVIWLLESVLRIVPRRTHDWRLFVAPDELRAAFSGAGIDVREIRGLNPARGKLAAAAAFARRRLPDFAIGDDLAISYVGFAIKPARVATK